MNITEERIRELTLKAIQELGVNANPGSVKKYIEDAIGNNNKVFESGQDGSSNRVILTSFGVNNMGIVSSITKALSDSNCDILDISQKIMQEFYTLIMLIDVTNSHKDIKDLQEVMNSIAELLKIKIYLQHEDVFKYMHRI